MTHLYSNGSYVNADLPKGGIDEDTGFGKQSNRYENFFSITNPRIPVKHDFRHNKWKMSKEEIWNLPRETEVKMLPYKFRGNRLIEIDMLVALVIGGCRFYQIPNLGGRVLRGHSPGGHHQDYRQK